MAVQIFISDLNSLVVFSLDTPVVCLIQLPANLLYSVVVIFLMDEAMIGNQAQL